MRALKLGLLLVALTATNIAFADVPVVDGYQQDDAQNSSQNNSSSNNSSNSQSGNSVSSNDNSDNSSNYSNNTQMADNQSSNNNRPIAPTPPPVSSLPTNQRIAILERQVNNMTQMLSQMNALQQQMQDLRGELELQTHNLQLLQDQVKSQYQDVDQRLSKAAGSTPIADKDTVKTAATDDSSPKPKKAKDTTASAAASQVDDATALTDNSVDNDSGDKAGLAKAAAAVKAKSPAVAAAAATTPAVAATDATAPATTASKGDDQAAYQTAFNLLKNKKYSQAATSFQGFIKQYPSSKNIVNAHYWLGQLCLLQGQPDKAIVQFKTILKNNPSDAKVPDSMLQLGLAYYAKGDIKQAKTQLTTVQQKFPDSSAAKLAQTRLSQIAQTSTQDNSGTDSA